MRRSYPMMVLMLSLIVVCFVTFPLAALAHGANDEVDDVVRTANAGIAALNELIQKNAEQITTTRSTLKAKTLEVKTNTEGLKVSLDLLQITDLNRLAYRKDARDRAFAAAIAQQIAAAQEAAKAAETDYYVTHLQTSSAVPVITSQTALSKSIQAMLDEFTKAIEEHKRGQSTLEAQIKQIDEQITRLKEQVEKVKRMAEAIEQLLPKFQELLTRQDSANKTKACFGHIVQDRTYASKLLAAIRANLNNPSGLTSALKKDSPGSDIDVREVKETSGLILILRIGALTHCLSTSLQCSGKPYSLVR